MQEGSSSDETPRTYSSAGMRGEYSVGSLLRQPVFAPPNDLQVSPYIQKMEITEEGRGRKGRSVGNVSGVHRIHSLRIFEIGLRRLFWFMGKIISNKPTIFIILPLLLIIGLIAPSFYWKDNVSIGIDFSSFISDGNSFSSHVSIYPLNDRPLISFNESNSNFDSINRISPYSYSIIITSIDEKETILHKENVESFLQLKRRVEGFDSNENAWEELCVRDCEGSKGLIDRLLKKSQEISVTYPEMFITTSKETNNVTRLYLGHSIGGVDTDMDGAITFARGLKTSFRLQPNTSNDMMRKWRVNFKHQVDTESATNPNLIIDKWSYGEFINSSLISLCETYSWLIVSSCVLALFCLLSVFGPNAYQSKPMVGISMGLSLLAACSASFSLHFIMNSHIQTFAFPIFFIIIGIGIVFIYSFHLSWSKFSAAAMHPGEKMAFIMAHDLPGIVLSSIVIIIPFLIGGIYIKTPLIKESFFLLSSGIIILVSLTVFFCAVAIFLSGKRESEGMKWYELCKTGDTQYCAPQIAIFDSFSMFSLHDRLLDSRPSITRSIGAFLVHPHFRYPIVFICSAYFIFAIGGCLNANIELREEYFVPSSSSTNRYMSNFRSLFGHTEEYLELTFDRSVDYWDENTKQSIMSLLESPVNEQYATRAVSWMTEFARFEKSSIYDISHETFVPVVNLVFLLSDQYKRFSNDIIFDRFQTQIVRSRMYLELSQKGVSRRIELVNDLLSRAKSANLPLSIKAPFIFSLKHDLEIMTTTTSTFFLIIGIIFILSLLLFAQPILSLLLLFTSIAVLIETIGYSSFWGVPHNVFTMTIGIAANSLTCIIVMAFCFHYSMSGRCHMSTKERIQYTYQSTLAPVAFASFVPVITFIPLLAIDAPIIQHIWKVLLVSSCASFIHFLFFLPNLLILLTQFAPRILRILKCEPCCKEDDGSIYYIPTAPRPVRTAHGIYNQVEYATYTVPRSIAPPGYLAIEPVYGLDAYCVSTLKRREHETSRAGGSETQRTHRSSSRQMRSVEVDSRPESVVDKSNENGQKNGRITRNNSRSGDDNVYDRIPNKQQERSASPRRARVQYDQSGRAFYEEVSLPSYPMVAGFHVPGSVRPVYAPSSSYVVPHSWKTYGTSNPTSPSVYYQANHQ